MVNGMPLVVCVVSSMPSSESLEPGFPCFHHLRPSGYNLDLDLLPRSTSLLLLLFLRQKMQNSNRNSKPRRARLPKVPSNIFLHLRLHPPSLFEPLLLLCAPLFPTAGTCGSLLCGSFPGILGGSAGFGSLGNGFKIGFGAGAGSLGAGFETGFGAGFGAAGSGCFTGLPPGNDEPGPGDFGCGAGTAAGTGALKPPDGELEEP